MHVAPQLIPAGALVTVPLPAPLLLTVSPYTGRENVAVTAAGPVIDTAHEPVPEHEIGRAHV